MILINELETEVYMGPKNCPIVHKNMFYSEFVVKMVLVIERKGLSLQKLLLILIAY
jgi:hypothetical protein